MVADDVARVREGYRAFARGDLAAVLDLLDPDIEWIEPEGYPWGRLYRGHDDVVTAFQTASLMLGPDWRVEPDDFVPTSVGVLVLGHHRGRNAAGDWAVPFAMVWVMRDGRAVGFRQYGDTALMREVAETPLG